VTGRRVYLIRHARPAGDGVPRYLGRTDPALSAEGREEARLLGLWFQGLKAGGVYCSPLRRCVETARYLSPDPVPVPGLEEIDMGTWEGRPRAEIRALYPADYEARGRDFAHFAPPGGESFAQAARRARAALKGILEGSGGDVAVVAHAGVNRALLCAAAGRPLQDLMTFPQRYCGVSTLRLTPDGLAVERVDELLWR